MFFNKDKQVCVSCNDSRRLGTPGVVCPMCAPNNKLKVHHYEKPGYDELLRENLRMGIQLGIINSLVSDANYNYDTGTDADYTTPLTDKVFAVVNAARAVVKGAPNVWRFRSILLPEPEEA